MKIIKRLFVLLLLMDMLMGSVAQACTTFCFYNPNAVVYGKNYDWQLDVGLVTVNRQGLNKFGTSQINTPRWTSKYGSVTFNQYGIEWPSGGMNTEGLVIELSWLNETEYALHEGDERDRLGTLSWIQYQLDTAATINDIITSDAHVKISPGSGAKVHYLACEASGACASIEFIKGEMQVHQQGNLPWSVLTNHSYEKSKQYAQTFLEPNAQVNARTGKQSLDRFVRAALAGKNIKELNNADTVGYAFKTLNSVKQGDYTKWQIVYDVKTMTVYWRTLKSPDLKVLSFDDLDFDCGASTKVMNVNSTTSGVVDSKLGDFSIEANFNLVTQAYSGTPFLKNVPDSALKSLAKFHSHFQCN
jgi:choloylglycine hydrolase